MTDDSWKDWVDEDFPLTDIDPGDYVPQGSVDVGFFMGRGRAAPGNTGQFVLYEHAKSTMGGDHVTWHIEDTFPYLVPVLVPLFKLAATRYKDYVPLMRMTVEEWEALNEHARSLGVSDQGETPVRNSDPDA